MGSEKIRLIQYPGFSGGLTLSPPCAKVHMALAYKGLDYTIHSCSTPMEAKRYNPRGRVPALEIGDATIVDSSDILDELERRYPNPPLLPRGREERAGVRILEDWADECLYFYGVYLRWIPPEAFARMKSEVLSRLPFPASLIAPLIAKREVKARAEKQGVGLKPPEVVMRELAGALDAIAGTVGEGSFLVGDEFTRADIAVAAVLDQLRLARLAPEVAALIDGHAAVVAYLERVHEKVPDAARPKER